MGTSDRLIVSPEPYEFPVNEVQNMINKVAMAVYRDKEMRKDHRFKLVIHTDETDPEFVDVMWCGHGQDGFRSMASRVPLQDYMLMIGSLIEALDPRLLQAAEFAAEARHQAYHLANGTECPEYVDPAEMEDPE